MLRRLFAVALIFLVGCVHHAPVESTKISAVQEAVEAAQIAPAESLEGKIKKALTLINEKHYYTPKGEPPKLPPPLDHPYHLDSLRTPEQILTMKVGGSCGSAALVFSAMLRNSGVKDDDLRIVLAVLAPDAQVICPSAGRERAPNPPTGASGHEFVAVKFPDGRWQLINTTDGSDYESMDWMPPEALAEKMKAGPVQIPFSMYRWFPRDLRKNPMIVFTSWSPDHVPLHTFDQRLDLVASGELNNRVCRYGAKDMVHLKKR